MINFSASTVATRQAERQYINNVTSAYKTALRDIDRQIQETYDKYAKNGVLTLEDMQRRNGKVTRLTQLQNTILNDIDAVQNGETQRLSSHLESIYNLNYQDGAKEIQDEVKRQLTFDMLNRDAIYRSSISDLGKIGLKNNADAVRNNIRQSLTQGIVQGEGIKTMSKRIQTDLQQNMNNAIRIARTETTRTMGTARMDVLKDARDLGITVQKRWVATNDGKTRPSHVMVNGETVDLDEPFSNGLMTVGDPNGPASEVINCRCAMVGKVVDDEEDQKEAPQEPQGPQAPKRTVTYQNRLEKRVRNNNENFDDTYKSAKLTGIDKGYQKEMKERFVELSNKYPIDNDKLEIVTTSNAKVFGRQGWGWKADKNYTYIEDYTIQFNKTYHKTIDEYVRLSAKNDLAIGKPILGKFSTLDHEYAHAIDSYYQKKIDVARTIEMLDNKLFGKSHFNVVKTELLDMHYKTSQLMKLPSLSNRIYTTMAKDYPTSLAFKQEIKAQFGNYALTNEKEFMAEGFSIMVGQDPAQYTPFTRKFADLFEKFYSEVILQ